MLKLDTQPRGHLLVEFGIQQGICTAPPPPSNMVLHPLQAKWLFHCKKWPVDGDTDLFV